MPTTGQMVVDPGCVYISTLGPFPIVTYRGPPLTIDRSVNPVLGSRNEDLSLLYTEDRCSRHFRIMMQLRHPCAALVPIEVLFTKCIISTSFGLPLRKERSKHARH